ncbi:TetR/AcrR family transcriptional regulator [Phytoactinopolyspora mesophila]|uniref:TetR family transcriptional regulator n=1 Tax=Phytoactinopolyspora mesophila TaxID=2650750 RepID=A0A7K3M4R4_9ACTN|nr:TetR/AcrR family transcriptional regulator [Phytoactinopolyspora mesophila]NDL58303.1 TetR family transcriptional regulator [Phytoactinopolyspora mesophila]
MTNEGRRRRAGGERREEVLDIVVEVLARRGYQQTRFKDVSEASSVAVSTLQGYFGSREDMLIEALHRATEREVATMERESRDIDDPWQRLVWLIDRGISTPVPVWRMLMEFWTAAAHDAELRRNSLDLQARYRQPLTAAIEHGRDKGDFTLRHEPAAVVDVVVAALDGLLYPRVLEQPRPDSDGFRHVLLDQLASTLGVRS